MKKERQDKDGQEALRFQTNRNELIARLSRALTNDGSAEPIPGLSLFRSSLPVSPLHAVVQPRLCIIAQGSKDVYLGKKPYTYDPYHYLLITAELPLVAHVLQASAHRPYLSLRLDLDPSIVSTVLMEVEQHQQQNQGYARAIDVSSLRVDLLDAVLRLVRLIESPKDASFIAPMIIREIIYRLLADEQGKRLRQVAVLGGHSHRITLAVKRLQASFDEQIPIKDLAEEAGMSVSSFYHHFKSVTGMSPLQLQKQLRLHEARRLMLNEDIDATTTSYKVGYNDASHFSREYKKLFGQPPAQHVKQLRESVL